ncbi:AAA family ATPase [Pseudomonas cannabina]|uniref:Nuclease SbcCD subunit C n=3 Tax=Pseudomonas syringae group TaxID=136849 RepID=A0A3M3QMP8_PSECA|nr:MULTISPECIES: AAA family ATPase [Pseudomonas syringae group]KPB75701.1 Exonuclease SbcC [Pseudomonas syringae pv. maculicola]KPW25230.1 Exonuclease SbcC [Pseudomonas cannabina pv. alisalensis]MBM0139742.1 AAA family ATPase [Pseudomonas cannabina pv. alisalensis]QHE98007.1 AAA family ATPase [Pseudomonas syringae pv. maculicola str. ES4326]QQN23784.1 AAA family ATPase [Pseudomonas cannabina pv. alisalensis]
MKILAIRLKNLASLAGPFELDFTAEPLASAGLFAITGPTGAGKSTLLDALCLALFGAIPRLSNIGQSKVPDIDGDISTSDPRTLLRRGTGSGYAEVDFIGIDQRRYRARWETNRARDNATKKLQASRQILTDLDSEQILSNQSKREFEQLVESRLGLNFEQFTRAVMLAQSEFSAFLKADDKERSELLEKLTNTAIYSQLGRRAYSKSKEAEEALKTLTAQASHIVPLAPEQLAELEQRFNDAQQQLKARQAQQRQLELKQQWLIELHRLRDERLAAQESLTRAQQTWDEQSLQRQTLAQLERLGPQRHRFTRKATLIAQLTPLAEQISQHQRQQTSLQNQQQQLETRRTEAQASLLTAQQAHGSAKPLLQQAFDAQNTLNHLAEELTKATDLHQQTGQLCTQGQASLQSLLDQQQQVAQRLERIAEQLQHSSELAPLAQAWSAWRDRLKSLTLIANRLKHGQQELPALQQRASEADQQLTEQRNALELLYREADCEVEAVTEQVQILGSLLQDNRKQQRAFEGLTRLWASQQDVDRQLADLAQQQQSAQQQRDQLNSEGIRVRDELAVAEQTLSVTRQLLERQRLARSASVEELRVQLQDDQPCPVCGSVEHPWHQPEALLESLTRHDDNEQASAQKAVDLLTEQRNQLREQVGGVIARQKELLRQHDQLIQRHQALAPNLEAHPLAAQLLDRDADKRDAWLSQQLSQLNDVIARDEQRQEALLTLQKDAARLQQQLQTATETSQTATRHVADQLKQLEADQQRLEEELAAFKPLVSPQVLEGLRNDASATVMQLEQQVTQRLDQLEQQSEEQQEQRERQQKIEKEQIEQQARLQRQTELALEVTRLGEQQQARQQVLADLLGEHATAEQWQQALENAIEQARQNETSATQTLQATQRQLIQLAAELKSGQQQQQALQDERTELEVQISEWRGQHPELDDAALDTLLAYDDAHVEQLRQQLHAAEKALEQDKVLLQERDQRLQQHQAQHSDLSDDQQLSTELQQAQEHLAQSEQQCADLRAELSEDQRRRTANSELQTRISEANSEYVRWARLAALIGSAEGDRFRKIAQAYNLDLLVHHANAQLRQLVRRYRLKRGGSMLGLLVMDTEMGDELRSVHSLSGGETFLVSLALALGLASMASSTLRIESLFIDEGFGSLDPESLQLAMDALDGLQAQGRKVGVISHVQEMHERIPVQIRVRRQGNGLSTIEVGS